MRKVWILKERGFEEMKRKETVRVGKNRGKGKKNFWAFQLVLGFGDLMR